MYKVVINKKILKSLDDVQPAYILKIKEAVNNLAENPRPHGCKRLISIGDTYRIRVGIYRIIYTIKDEILTVNVIKIGHRSSAYKY
jgi:mRNA interferase RelE/StbE